MSQAGMLNVNGGGGGGSPIETITGNSGGAVPPTGNNINLVGGGGVTVVGTPGTSTLTISIPNSSMTWSDQATSFAAVADNGYFVTAAATATLPSTAVEGTTIVFYATSTGAVTVTANTGQIIEIGTATSASAGVAVSTHKGDSLTLTYQLATTTWWGRAVQGSWSVT
jgi:hypothetical protein